MKNRIGTKRSIWIAIVFFLLCSCSGSPDFQAGPWQIVGVYDQSNSTMTAGFLDEQHVIIGGVIGQMAYSSDGAKTWLATDAHADCRYGLEIVSPGVIWTCGGATHVRRSINGGKTWEAVANFGDPRTITNPCHSMSFLDENTGWLANSNLFGSTTDGGESWIMAPIPETANKISTIDTYSPGEGYLLDQDGALFFTQDNGGDWGKVSQLDLGDLKMSFSVYQLAAMRFTDREHGLIIISPGDVAKAGPVIAFHTSDGGQSWASEVVSVAAGPVYLSREGMLTVITAANQLTLLKYTK